MKGAYSFLVFGGVLYILGLLGGSYSATPLGFEIDFNTRDGIFFSTLFFAVGVLFSGGIPRISKAVAVCIAFVGLVIFCLEAYYPYSAMVSANPIYHDYLLGSIPFGVGMFLFAMQHRKSIADQFISRFAPYVLGIYVKSHDLLDLFGSFSKLQPLVWQFVFPVIVFSTSLFFTIIVSKTFLRRFVI